MTQMTAHEGVKKNSGRVHFFGAAVLGFALGGFFDGILLHQVLQWHHFLSLLPGERYQNLEVQILADGLLHVALYLIALAGLVMLWARGQDRPGDRMTAWAFLGFSIWQFADVVLVHWLIGIHRIRVGVPNPLFWDLGWLGAFGLTTLIIGLWLLFRSRPPNWDNGRRGAALLSGTVVISALAPLLSGNNSSTVVLFRPGMQPQQTFAAAAAAHADILWSDSSGRILVLNMPPATPTWRLYMHGALLVGNTGAVGCMNWTRV